MTGLLDLPSEIRVMIYRMLFPKQDIHVIKGVAIQRSIAGDVLLHSRVGDAILQSGVGCAILQSKSRLDPSIIRVSRQMANEIPPVLYSQTSFHIYAGHGSEDWLCQINKANRDYLRIVTCHLHPKDLPSLVRSLKLLVRCSHISLTIETTMESLVWKFCFFNQSLFENLHGFANVSITLHPTSQRHCNLDYRKTFEMLKRRVDDGVQRMVSPCPGYCEIHTEGERSQATASMHVIFPDLYVVDPASYTVSATWMERSDLVNGL